MTKGERAGEHACDCGRYARTTKQILASIDRRLAWLARAQTLEGVTMAQIDDRLGALQTTLGEVGADLADDTAEVTRLIADLKQSMSGDLTPEQESAFDALDTLGGSLKSAAEQIKSAIEAGDPSPTPVPEPAPEPAPTPTA